MKRMQFKRVFRLISEIEHELLQNSKMLLKSPNGTQINRLLTRYITLTNRKQRLRQIKINL